MKFIVDAQLPQKLAFWLIEQGFDTIHTLDLPKKNLTEDMVIISLSMAEERTVISKDSDFYEYYVLKEMPYKLLMITTGNLVNKALIQIFQQNFDKICELLEENRVVELNNTELIVHF